MAGTAPNVEALCFEGVHSTSSSAVARQGARARNTRALGMYSGGPCVEPAKVVPAASNMRGQDILVGAGDGENRGFGLSRGTRRK